MTKMSAAMGGWLRGLLLLFGHRGDFNGRRDGGDGRALCLRHRHRRARSASRSPWSPYVGRVLGEFSSLRFGPTWKLIVAVIFFVIPCPSRERQRAGRQDNGSGRLGLSPLTTILALASGAALLGTGRRRCWPVPVAAR